MEILEGIPERLQLIRPKRCADPTLEAADSNLDRRGEPVPIPEVVRPRMESAEHSDEKMVAYRVPHYYPGAKLVAHRRIGNTVMTRPSGPVIARTLMDPGLAISDSTTMGGAPRSPIATGLVTVIYPWLPRISYPTSEPAPDETAIRPPSRPGWPPRRRGGPPPP